MFISSNAYITHRNKLRDIGRMEGTKITLRLPCGAEMDGKLGTEYGILIRVHVNLFKRIE